MSEPDATNVDFNAIGTAAEFAATAAGDVQSDERLRKLEERIANIEPLLEQMQVHAGIGIALGHYVANLQAEQLFFNRARYAVGFISILSIFGLIGLLALAVFHSASPLLRAPPVAIATFIVGLVSGIVFLLVAFTKGVFRSTAERHADGFLPPALEKAAEIYDKIWGK